MKKQRKKIRSPYPTSLLLPGAILYLVLFFIPTVMSLFFSLTRWTLQEWSFVGLENFKLYFSEEYLRIGFRNTIIYGFFTSALKVILGLYLAAFLSTKLRASGFMRSVLFFPTLVSTIGVGITFSILLNPWEGVVNQFLKWAAGLVGFTTDGPGWLVDPNLLPIISVALVDVWKGVGIATLIYIAGIAAIPTDYYEAASIDGASKRQQFYQITLALSRPAMFTVIILSFVGGLRSFDLIWAMTGGGPGFITDVLGSINYKQYTSGYYGLATAGNVILFALVSLLVFPLARFLNKKEVTM
jgi:raffinose/stachyose/melibiose transport system permease protein